MKEEKLDEEIVFRSSRFGEVKVPASTVITILGGVIGFPKETKFVVLDYNPPFPWLHSVENPDLAFVVVNAAELGPNYLDRLPATDQELKINLPDELSVITVVTVRPNPADTTVNLKAPILVYVDSRFGRQIILEDPDLSIRMPLFSSQSDAP